MSYEKDIIVEVPTNAYTDPGRVYKQMGSNKNAGENIGLGVLGTVDAVLETPFAIIENFGRGVYKACGGKLVEKKKRGSFYLPVLKTERIFSKEDGDNGDVSWIKLRDSFCQQHNDKNLHRLDFKFTPTLDHEHEKQDYRIMKLDVKFELNDGIECTDIFPQTKWVQEGLSVGDTVSLNAKLHFEPRPKNSEFGEMAVGSTTAERDYYYSIKYETLVPEITVNIYSNVFEWKLRGTYEKFITGTQFHSAVLLVPPELKESKIKVLVRIGITNRSRKETASYPADSELHYSDDIIFEDVPLVLGTKQLN